LQKYLFVFVFTRKRSRGNCFTVDSSIALTHSAER